MQYSTTDSLLPTSGKSNQCANAATRDSRLDPEVRSCTGLPNIVTQQQIRYIQRDGEELGRLESERRPGRPSSTREDLLKRRVDTENREYEAGFWIPDMEDADNVAQLERWTGEWTSLNTLKYIRFTRDGRKRASAFPPKAQS